MQREGRAFREESGILSRALLQHHSVSSGGSGLAPHAESLQFRRSGADSVVRRLFASTPPRVLAGDEGIRISGLSSPLASDPYEAVRATPSECYRRMLVVLPLIHFMVGLMNGFTTTPFMEYLVHGPHPVSPAHQTLLGNVVGQVPWNLKIFAAFLSDICPIVGRRRIPYLVIGCLLKGSAWIALGFRPDFFTFPLLCLQQFLGVLGQMVTGTMCDTLIVENVKYESGTMIGTLQSRCYFMMSFGSLLSNPMGGWLLQYAGLSTGVCFLIEGIGVFSIVLLCLLARDPKVARVDDSVRVVQETFAGVWNAAKLLRVMKPLMFIFIFANMPSNSQAFNSYLVMQNPICHYNRSIAACQSSITNSQGTIEYSSWCKQYNDASVCDTRWGGLDFSPSEFSYIGTLGNAGSALGNFLFAVWLMRSQWHWMFGSTVIFASLTCCLQLFLYFRDADGRTLSEQWHLPNIVFALGDDVVMSMANQLVALPLLILMARLVPRGAEGTTYALVTSVQMAGTTVSGAWSSIGISSFGIANYDFSNLWKWTLFCSLIKLVCLPLLPLVPRDITDASDERSRLWAALLVGCLFFGALGFSLYNVAVALIV